MMYTQMCYSFILWTSNCYIENEKKTHIQQKVCVLILNCITSVVLFIKINTNRKNIALIFYFYFFFFNLSIYQLIYILALEKYPLWYNLYFIQYTICTRQIVGQCSIFKYVLSFVRRVSSKQCKTNKMMTWSLLNW